MNEKKEKLRVFQRNKLFVLRRSVETIMDSEEYNRLLNSMVDNEDSARMNVESAKERYELLVQDHKELLRLKDAAQAVRNAEVTQGKLDLAKALAREKRMRK